MNPLSRWVCRYVQGLCAGQTLSDRDIVILRALVCFHQLTDEEMRREKTKLLFCWWRDQLGELHPHKKRAHLVEMMAERVDMSATHIWRLLSGRKR